MVKPWNSLPREMVETSSLEAFERGEQSTKGHSLVEGPMVRIFDLEGLIQPR